MSNRHGEAGRRGDGVRSDLFVAIEGADSGGVELELRSKVELYYGDAIREQAREILAALGVDHAHLTIDDRGALPFAIGARIETAARRAGLVDQGRAASVAETDRPATERDRLRRSRLYLPGDEPKYMINAGLHGPDAVILDLEDSVHPSEKDAARHLVRDALAGIDFGAAERMVRINQAPLGLEDLTAVIPSAPDLILIPKVEDPAEVERIAAWITGLQESLERDRAIWLMPIIESALGVEHAFEIARASERVVALTLGLEDLTADLGVPKTRAGDETLYARSRVVNAARAARVQAIDSVYGDVGDAGGLAAWCRRARALGFEGMGCIHPGQITTIHAAFAPSEEELEKALRMVAAFEEAGRKNLGVVSLGSKMIDPPVVERARTLVARARAMGRLEE